MASAPNKQNDIEPITSTPKIFTGTKTENNKAEKPITTDKPLKRIPFPDIFNVFELVPMFEAPIFSEKSTTNF